MQYPPGSAPTDLAAFNRFLKILYFTLFGTVGMYWLVLEMLAAQIEPRELGFTRSGFGAAAAATGGLVAYLRFARIGAFLAEVSGDFGQRLARLRFHYILCYTLSETVALYGFVLRFLGGSREDSIPFFLAAVVLFLLCYPRPPQPPAAPGGPTG